MIIKDVNCRIGSLEIFLLSIYLRDHVNCRIGSLETYGRRTEEYPRR